MDRPIFISSANRDKRGVSRPDHFTVKFTPALDLPTNQKHSLALDQLSMTYSWHNITPEYNNNTVKYSHDGGKNWSTVKFSNGMFSYDDLNTFLADTIKQYAHDPKNITITFVLTTYKCLVELKNGYQLDLRGTKFGELIGFEPKIVTKTEYGTKLPNITNSIDALHIRTSAISDSWVDGEKGDTLAVVTIANLKRSYPFHIQAHNKLFSPLKSPRVSEMTVYVTDSLGRPVNLNGVDWNLTMILRSENIVST